MTMTNYIKILDIPYDNDVVFIRGKVWGTIVNLKNFLRHVKEVYSYMFIVNDNAYCLIG